MILNVAYRNEIFDWKIKKCFYWDVQCDINTAYENKKLDEEMEKCFYWDLKYHTQVYIYI